MFSKDSYRKGLFWKGLGNVSANSIGSGQPSSTTPSPRSSVGSIEDLRTGGHWFEPPARPIFFPRIYDSHYDRIHSSLKALHCFDNGYLGKQLKAWKENCAEYWIKELKKSIERCTGRRDITEITLNMRLNTIQSINLTSGHFLSMD